MCNFSLRMCTFGDLIFRDLAAPRPIDTKQLGEKKKVATPTFSYRIESSESGQPIKASQSLTCIAERPNSAPYLVESTSHCHLSRVAEITQEWRVERDPEQAECRATVTPLKKETYRAGTSWLKVGLKCVDQKSHVCEYRSQKCLSRLLVLLHIIVRNCWAESKDTKNRSRGRQRKGTVASSNKMTENGIIRLTKKTTPTTR